MFTINEDQSIFLTRGDIAVIEVSAGKSENENYTFKIGDVVRFRILEKNKCDNVVLQKDIVVETERESVEIPLYKDDTKIGEIINKPKEYWYEIELNPDTNPQTMIGYDAAGPKIFKLFPEGDDL